MKGSIIKRGKTYSIVYDVGRALNGKRQQKWESGFNTKREAQETLNDRLHEIKNNDYIPNSKLTLAEYLNDWFTQYVEKNLAINTVCGYRNNIYKHIIPGIGNIQLTMLNPIQIQKFYNKKLTDGLSPTSVIYIHRVLRKALEQAYKMRIISKNVADLVELPRKIKYKSQSLTEEQAKELLEVAKDSEIFIPILLGITLGLRRGEVLALRWKDIDFESKTISVSRTAVKYKGEVIYTSPKTEDSNRIIKAPAKLIEILENEKINQEIIEVDFDNIICCRNKTPISQDTLNKQFKVLLRMNNLPDIRFHDLRHTNATLMLKNNIPAKIASQRLGHSSIGITMDLYTHVFVEMQNEAAEVINDLFE